MNSFQMRSIQPSSHEERDQKPPKGIKSWVKRHIFLSLILLIVFLFTVKGVAGAISKGNFGLKQIFVSAVEDKVATDAYGHTNILLIGVGGEGHDGENLTDTMIVASLDHEKNTVSMISVPRDFYVENAEVGWGTRLNSVYEYVLDESQDPAHAMNELENEIEKILDVDIQYYAKIDFTGFTEIVDALGGIDVTVEQNIADETYPAPDGSAYLYDPFYISAGEQHLTGEIALKYARSRHSAGGDFDRARRQQQVLEAIKDKALSLGVLTSPSRIKDLYAAISSNFETDMEIDEMLSLVDFGQKLTGDSVLSAVLSDDATKMGGFLITPPREENDPFFLVPTAGEGNNVELQLFAQLFFYHPEIYQAQVPIEVLNGTKVESLAGLTKMYLVRYGFNVINYDNGPDRELVDTRIISRMPGNEDTVEVLPSLIFGEILSAVPTEYLPENWPSEAEIIVELGSDFGSFYSEHQELFYIGVY